MLMRECFESCSVAAPLRRSKRAVERPITVEAVAAINKQRPRKPSVMTESKYCSSRFLAIGVGSVGLSFPGVDIEPEGIGQMGVGSGAACGFGVRSARMVDSLPSVVCVQYDIG